MIRLGIRLPEVVFEVYLDRRSDQFREKNYGRKCIQKVGAFALAPVRLRAGCPVRDVGSEREFAVGPILFLVVVKRRHTVGTPSLRERVGV
ncbi:MAG: hypothetical protein VYA36_04855, partial [Pseudomonadota bacterium]|nr:hypothetical protein [Pseudomonadota bacterium]